MGDIMYRFFLSILFFCHFLWATEEFYIFPMGQGNSQLVIYERPEGKVGILYDLGSKSLQMHPKFGTRGAWQQPFLFPIKATHLKEIDHEKSEVFPPTPSRPSIRRNSQKAATNSFSEEDEMLFPPTPIHPPATTMLQTPGTTEKKLSGKQRDTIKNELEKLVSEQLESLDQLFIFLSHSDEDHINFLNHENIPEHVPITVILAGDWFGDIGAEDGKTNFTEPAKKVLIFLSQRISKGIPTHVYFPYYSPELNHQIIEMLQPHVLLEAISGQKISEALETLDVLAQPIIGQCLKINPAAPTPRFLHGPFLEVFGHLPIDPRFQDILNNVYIWSLNQPADDTNNHSMVVSCTLPNLNMSVILTGDAENSVFHRIVAENTERNFLQILMEHGTFERIAKEKPDSNSQQLLESHLVMLMLPHHGSLANRSGCMLRFFTPNVFGISAGDGGRYAHPSIELIEQIRRIYSESTLQHQLQIFDQQYGYRDKFHFIALNDKKQVIDKAEREKLLFLCPNIYGCIKWDQEGIRTNFSNSITINTREYSMSYASHVLEADIQTIESSRASTQIPTTSPESSVITMLTLLEPTAARFSYDYLTVDVNGDFFVGINIVDEADREPRKPKKVYFYRLLAAG